MTFERFFVCLVAGLALWGAIAGFILAVVLPNGFLGVLVLIVCAILLGWAVDWILRDQGGPGI